MGKSLPSFVLMSSFSFNSWQFCIFERDIKSMTGEFVNNVEDLYDQKLQVEKCT